MPFYEYECTGCGHQLEAMQKFSDAPLRKCPSCGKSKLKKLMSAPAFRLSGSGWYETDFKGDKDKKRNLAGETDNAEKTEKPADKPADAAKSEAKPAEKAAEKSAEKSAEKADAKPTQKAAEPPKVASKSASKTNKKAVAPVKKARSRR